MRGADGEAGLLPGTVRGAGEIVADVLDWFDSEAREYVWRKFTATDARVPGNDPYVVLLSEVMLQQTQSSRVSVRLPEFLEKFPAVRHLADATQADLIRAWHGMGYNRRALSLHAACRVIVREFGGRIPDTYDALRSLPGIGDYTARAILCFGYGRDIPVVDVNIRRVLSRIFYKCHTLEQVMPERTVLALDNAIMPSGDASRWHQALMDIGSGICTARRANCTECPVATRCLSSIPSPLKLFDPRSVRKSEPELRGTPRRIWRGRILQLMRTQTCRVRISGIIDGMMPHATVTDRKALLEFVQGLITDGLLRRARNGVGEPSAVESDLVELPE